jgi:hypothetical protein
MALFERDKSTRRKPGQVLAQLLLISVSLHGIQPLISN